MFFSSEPNFSPENPNFVRFRNSYHLSRIIWQICHEIINWQLNIINVCVELDILLPYYKYGQKIMHCRGTAGILRRIAVRFYAQIVFHKSTYNRMSDVSYIRQPHAFLTVSSLLCKLTSVWLPGFLNFLVGILDFLDNLPWSCKILIGLLPGISRIPGRILAVNPRSPTLGC